ncbi:hypothetical protein K1719_042574 [Acacia pycnantha]|nr:hypothetical protein K1719_042574 [Acacia pycnantha]
MLGNCEKMVLIPQNTKEWPHPQRQDHEIDDQKVSTASSSSSSSAAQRVMEKPNQELLQQQQEALKCPRCDSSNTKFCYYNNYSLSQPRHFCKACKRYWTRGGTLRNVPVGGGCRKNKRTLKRPNSTASSEIHNNITSTPSSNSSSYTVSAVSISNPPSQSHQIDIASTSNHISPLFYGINLPFPRFNSTSVFDHHHNSLGLDFIDNIAGYRNGFSSNHTLVSSYTSSIFASSSSSTSVTTSSTVPPPPIMASLLSSTNLQQQKFINNGGATNNSTFQGFINNSNNSTSTEAEMVALKEVKSVVVGEDDDSNRFLGWQNNHQIEHHQAGGLIMSDPTSSLYWNTTTATAMGSTNTWNDQTNIGPHQSLLSSSDLQ